MTRVVIRYRGPGAALSWLAEDERGRIVDGPHAMASAPPRATLAGAREVVVLVPATDALVAETKLATRARDQLARAIPFALEDQLAEPVEAMHFAHVAAGDGQLVAYVRRDTLRAWLEDLASRGIEPDVVAPESLGLPLANGRATVLIESHAALVRLGDGRAFSVEREALPAWLARCEGPRDERGRIVADVLDLTTEGSAPLLALDVADTLEGPALPLLARGARAPLPNFLGGGFAARHRGESTRRLWRLAAVLTVAAVLLAFGHAVTERVLLARRAAALSAEIERTYRAAFPGVTRITANPRGQMEGELRRMRVGAQGAGALALLQRVAPIVTSGTQHRIEGIEYRNGTLELEVQAPAVVALDALREGVATLPGLRVELAAATTGERGASGRLRIREATP
ncbi:MAG TPA: type II secretion system protein GspL [Xanthomonadales bacterium]|nr:type II secretion system protein GspL [Xanthomonadales bacterium]